MLLPSPTVSIILTADDTTSDLPVTIDSILQQTYSDWEIIVFSPNLESIMPWLRQKRDPRLKLTVQRDVGAAETFNQGILEAQGKYICFIKAGDLWHSDKLQQQISYLDRDSKTGLVDSWTTLFDRSDRSIRKISTNKYSGWVELEILQRNRIILSSVMVRRSCFERVGLFDPKLFAPDWDLWIRLSRHYQFMTIAEPLTYCQEEVGRRRVLETDLHLTIEKAYANLPADLERLKNLSYSYASLDLARSVLKDRNPDLAIALNYCHQTLQHYPLMGLSAEFLKVRLTIMAWHYLQGDRYKRLLRLMQTAKQLISP